MSWIISFVGKPSNVATALHKHSESLEGQSKVEYDAALPHMVALAEQNFGPDAEQILIKLEASGHGYAVGEDQRDRTFRINLERIYVTIV